MYHPHCRDIFPKIPFLSIVVAKIPAIWKDTDNIPQTSELGMAIPVGIKIFKAKNV